MIIISGSFSSACSKAEILAVSHRRPYPNQTKDCSKCDTEHCGLLPRAPCFEKVEFIVLAIKENTMRKHASAILAAAFMILSVAGPNASAHAAVAGVPNANVFNSESNVIMVGARRHHHRHDRRHWRHHHRHSGWYGHVRYRPCRVLRVKVWSPRHGHYVWRHVKRCGYAW